MLVFETDFEVIKNLVTKEAKQVWQISHFVIHKVNQNTRLNLHIYKYLERRKYSGRSTSYANCGENTKKKPIFPEALSEFAISLPRHVIVALKNDQSYNLQLQN